MEVREGREGGGGEGGRVVSLTGSVQVNLRLKTDQTVKTQRPSHWVGGKCGHSFAELKQSV